MPSSPTGKEEREIPSRRRQARKDYREGFNKITKQKHIEEHPEAWSYYYQAYTLDLFFNNFDIELRTVHLYYLGE